MIEKYTSIICNQRIPNSSITNRLLIANHILIPENGNEKAQGMRYRNIDNNTAMLFIFPCTEYLVFNMYDVNYSLGIIVLNDEKEIVDIGIMAPYAGGYSGYGRYVLEIHSDNIKNLKIGDKIEF